MTIITDKAEVMGLYQAAAERQWVLPCFCTENQTTTEAILEAARVYGLEKGIKQLPVIIAITCNYNHRAQSPNYTQTRRWDVGLKLFLNDLRILSEDSGPYGDLDIMIHLDHIQFDQDRELLSWDLGQFSSIMFDAGAASLAYFTTLYRQDIVYSQMKRIAKDYFALWYR